MITTFYPSEARKKPRVVVTYSYGQPTPAERATKLGITIPEYWRRKSVVTRESNDCKFMLGQKVFPSRLKDYRKHGEVRVVAICRDYDYYGEVEWNDPPFILQLMDGNNKVINCTIGWASVHAPVDPEESLGAC